MKRETKKERDARLAVDARVNEAIGERLNLWEVLTFMARMEDAFAAAEASPGSVELMKLKQLNGKKLGDLTREDCLWQASVLANAADRVEKMRKAEKAEQRRAKRT